MDNKHLIQFFSCLADDTRLKIILDLMKSPKNVGEIHKSVGKNKITLSAVSHQLKLLSDVNIIQSKRNGREKIFSLSDKFCWCILKDALKHFNSKTKCKSCVEAKKGM